MRYSSLFIMTGVVFLLSACGTNSDLLTSSEERTDDVYFPEKKEPKSAQKEQKERVTTASADTKARERKRPDYYNPKVADQLEWEELQRRNGFYRRSNSYYKNDGKYRSPSYYGNRRSSIFHRFPTGGNNNSSLGNKNSGGGGGSSVGDSDSDPDSDRDRSYDSSDSKRKR